MVLTPLKKGLQTPNEVSCLIDGDFKPSRVVVAQKIQNLRAVKQLSRQRDHAINEIRFDDHFPDIAFAALIGRHAAVRQHESAMPFGAR